MSPRLASLRALLKRPRAVPAALLLAVSALATLAGPAHLALDAALSLHARATAADAGGHDHVRRDPAQAAFEAGCPADCSDPHHAHRAHDHATCPTCRAFGAACLAPVPVAPIAPRRLVATHADRASRALSRATESPAARGPPASLSAAAAS